MVKKGLTHKELVPVALLLVGVVMLVEAAAAMFVLVGAPDQVGSAYAAWAYVLLKSLVSLFVIFVGYRSTRK